MPRLSIVIAACDNGQRLEAGLVSVLENRPDDCEILVVHDGSYEDPYDLSGEVTFLEAGLRASWTDRANLAIQHCNGEVVHLLDSGAKVREGWADLAIRHFDDSAVAAVAPLVVEVGDPRQVISAGLNYRSGSRRLITRVQTRCTGPQNVCGAARTAAFYRRSVLSAIGGLSGVVGDRLADVDLALIVGRMGLVTRLEPSSLVLVERAQASAETTFRSGLYAERLYRRNLREETGLMAKLAHGFVVAGEAISCLWRPAKTGRILGRMIALCGVRGYREHRRWLDRLESQQDTGEIDALAFPSAGQESAESLDSQSSASHRRAA